MPQEETVESMLIPEKFSGLWSACLTLRLTKYKKVTRVATKISKVEAFSREASVEVFNLENVKHTLRESSIVIWLKIVA